MSSVNAVRFLGTSTDDVAYGLTVYRNSFVSAPRSGVFLFDNPMGVVSKKPASGQKASQFLMGSDVPAPEEFTPGNELMGQIWSMKEGTITTDKYIVCHKWIPKDQMKWSHVDILPELAMKHKKRIEREMDRRIFILAVAAARTAAVNEPSTQSGPGYNIHNGGNKVSRTGTSLSNVYAASSGGATLFRTDLRRLAALMDEDNVSSKRLLWIAPAIREVLAFDSSATLWSKDYQNVNNLNDRVLDKIDGFIPMGYPNYTSNDGPFPNEDIINTTNSKYTLQASVKTGDTTNGTPAALVLAVGDDGETAVGLDVYQEPENFVGYYPEKMSWLVMTSMLSGGGVMHPWCAGTIEAVSAS